MSLKDMAKALRVSSAYLSALEHGRRGKPTWMLLQRIIAYFNVIWDEAEDLQRLAEMSDPKVTIDTAGMAPEATELANRLARDIGKLEPEDLKLPQCRGHPPPALARRSHVARAVSFRFRACYCWPVAGAMQGAGRVLTNSFVPLVRRIPACRPPRQRPRAGVSCPPPSCALPSRPKPCHLAGLGLAHGDRVVIGHADPLDFLVSVVCRLAGRPRRRRRQPEALCARAGQRHRHLRRQGLARRGADGAAASPGSAAPSRPRSVPTSRRCC